MSKTLRLAIINSIATSAMLPVRLRTVAYRLAGIDIHWRAIVQAQVLIRGGHLKIGARSTINLRCIIDCWAPVVIGENCGIGIGVHLITSTHDYTNPLRRAGTGFGDPITIGDGVWIGSGATILGGVNIGDGCVVAAGAVIHEDCEAHGIYGGVPARLIRRLDS